MNGSLDLKDAFTAAEMLIHYVTSTPDRLAAFASYVQECPDGKCDGGHEVDLALLRRGLSRAHDLLVPHCDEPIEVI